MIRRPPRSTLFPSPTLFRSAVFIFQIASTLTTASNGSVMLVNGGSPCNVFWQVGSSATLGTGTAFVGNILALTDRKSTRLNSSHLVISYAVFCLKKKKQKST